MTYNFEYFLKSQVDGYRSATIPELGNALAPAAPGCGEFLCAKRQAPHTRKA